MNYTEHAIGFACGQDTLIGVLASPEVAGPVGVIVIVGGPQYRAGSHRQFVLLSRSLAAAGIAVLRFDYTGMGDSTGVQKDFGDVTPDIGAAIDALQAHLPHVRQVALWGMCDGASAALMYCQDTRDPRVAGLCLLNPWVRSEASLARAHVKHYYTRRLRQKEFWVKLASGKVAGAALAGLWRNVRMFRAGAATASATRQLTFQQRMALGWRNFNGDILLLLSGDDYTAKEFVEYAGMDPAWAGLLKAKQLVRHDLPGADHTFSDSGNRAAVETYTLNWLLQCTNR